MLSPMVGKSHSFEDLLDATLSHLERLKATGARWVAVQRDHLAPLDLSALRSSNSLNSPDRSEKPSFDSAHSESQSHAQSAPTPASPRKSSPPQPRQAFQGSTEKSVPTAAPSVKPGARAGTSSTQASSESKNSKANSDWLSEVLPANEREAAMEALRKETLACVQCPNLAESRKNVVFGVGSITADLMFVGEAPGMDEDEQGEPFVGKAGQLLTKIIEATGLSRDKVYIANALKCRPDTPGQNFGNRKPNPEEIERCLPFVERQIELIRPKVLVALGASAVEALYGEKIFITKIRGQRRDYRGIPLIPTFHPSYLLRNSSHAVKRLVWEDMMQAMDLLGMPISEKQRGFFKK